MGRAPCCDNNGLKKGPWTQEEDQKLIDYIEKHGHGNWRILPKNAGLQRCGKSCRLRWTNYLRPDIKRGRFSFEDEETIIQLHSILGNKWSAIAARLPGRTDNEIKNYWNTHIRKKLLRMGIDPVTHSPRLDLLGISTILRCSLYSTSSQMNISSLLEEQPLVNPELLKFASSLVSSRTGNSNFCSTQENQQLYNPQMNDPIIRLMQANQIQQLSTPCVSYPLSESQFVESNAEGYPSGINYFSTQDSQLSHLQNSGVTTSALTDDCHVAMPSYDYYAHDQSAVDPNMRENSTFYLSSCNKNFGFTSVLSTPSSSPTPMNSNSNVNSCSSSAEDERESYGSNNHLQFGIPDIIDVDCEFI